MKNSNMYTNSFNVLLVEDNPDDVYLTLEALKEAKLAIEMHVAKDGLDALEFLHREGDHINAPVPDLILLDLNLPKKDGREVLAEIKEDERFRRIPVVILSTSKADEDVLQAYDNHANCYITKPIDLDMFIKVVQAIKDFWLTIVKLPSE